jgi:hypothetical protein
MQKLIALRRIQAKTDGSPPRIVITSALIIAYLFKKRASSGMTVPILPDRSQVFPDIHPVLSHSLPGNNLAANRICLYSAYFTLRIPAMRPKI